MTKFEKAFIPQSERMALYEELFKKWKSGDPDVRKAFPDITTEYEAQHTLKDYVDDVSSDLVFKNDTYQVTVREMDSVLHLSIKRNDRATIHDWRELQEIKNEIVGPEHEAVELYPAESRLVDTANQYHLWVVKDPNYRFPFGFDSRIVTETAFAKSVNRPFAR